MAYDWKSCSTHIKDFIFNFHKEITDILKNELIGFYLHGSLAMGGFNPDSSDIDLLVVTKKSITVETKRKLAKLFLIRSKSPFPVEISFLNHDQVKNWMHPCPFDFHYSEFWREAYQNDLLNGTSQYLNDDVNTDSDLAAHITIINNRGICVHGRPIGEVFPLVPQSDYILSIVADFNDCLENIEKDPIYCTLNLIRVFWYLKEGVISSKQEAGNWGLMTLPKEMSYTLKKVVEIYATKKDKYSFEKDELLFFKKYFSGHVQKLLN